MLSETNFVWFRFIADIASPLFNSNQDLGFGSTIRSSLNAVFQNQHRLGKTEWAWQGIRSKTQ